MRRFAFLTPLAALLLLATTLPAQDGVPDPKELFQQLDRNKDGKLVADEIPKDQTRFFERLLRTADKNGDGQLTLDEFIQGHKADDGPGLPLNNIGGQPGRGPGDLKQRFDMHDRNKDGKVTRDEVPDFARERLNPVFDRLGKDELTFDDFRQAFAGGAPGGGQNPEQMFGQLDTNGDGKITDDDKPRDGARRLLEQVRRRTGKGEGEEISREEFLRAMASRPNDGPPEGRRPEGEGPRMPLFVRLLDADRDGRISKDELSRAAELFSQLDRNQDGQLDMFELMGPPPEGGDQPGGRPPRREGAERPPGDGNPGTGRQFFERMDRNGDGKISKDEAGPRIRDRFEQLDKNGDGFLTPDELRAAGPPGGRPETPDGTPRKRPTEE